MWRSGRFLFWGVVVFGLADSAPVRADLLADDSAKTVFTREDGTLKQITGKYEVHEPPKICRESFEQQKYSPLPPLQVTVELEAHFEKLVVSEEKRITKLDGKLSASGVGFDLLGDGQFAWRYVDDFDFSARRDYGVNTPGRYVLSSIVVPNPATMLLMLVGGVLAFRFKPRKATLYP